MYARRRPSARARPRLRARDGRARRAAAAVSALATSARRGSAVPRVPAHRRPAHPRAVRARGARAMGAPAARAPHAGRLRPARGGKPPDRPPRRLGLRRACADLAVGNAVVSVNVSAHQLGGGELPVIVQAVLEQTGLPASRLLLELTEHDRIGRRGRRGQLRRSSVSVCGSRSTTSARATPRWSTSAGCRSTS